MKFEWVGGRIHSKDLLKVDLMRLWHSITEKCSAKTGLRLLISYPEIGPANSLKQILSPEHLQDLNFNFLKDLIEKENAWLDSQRKEADLEILLQNLGWQIIWETWEENLTVVIEEGLISRWLDDGGEYRSFLKKEFDNKVLDNFRKLLVSFKGKVFPQKLVHRRMIGKKI